MSTEGTIEACFTVTVIVIVDWGDSQTNANAIRLKTAGDPWAGDRRVLEGHSLSTHTRVLFLSRDCKGRRHSTGDSHVHSVQKDSSPHDELEAKVTLL